MQQDEVVILSSKSDTLIDITRVILGIFTLIILIFLYPINQNATIVFLIMIFLMILLSAKSKVEIHEDFILFTNTRIIKFTSSEIRIDFNQVEQIHYYPKKLYWLIVLLPGYGGFQDSELIFKLKNSKQISKKIRFDSQSTKKILKKLDDKSKVLLIHR